MATNDKTQPSETKPLLPEGSILALAVHMGVGFFFIIVYFLFRQNVETIKALILGYYTLFNVLFLFIYHQYLRNRNVYLFWLAIGFLQLLIYFFNINNLLWDKWGFSNVLSVLTGLPVILVLYNLFRRMALQREGKDLVIGFRTLYKPTNWDIAATILIPVITLVVTLL